MTRRTLKRLVLANKSEITTFKRRINSNYNTSLQSFQGQRRNKTLESYIFNIYCHVVDKINLFESLNSSHFQEILK